MDKEQIWAAVAEARVALADELDRIEADAWDKPSLCGGWTVRDVVSHLVSLAEQKPGLGTMMKYARIDLRPNKAIDKQARRVSSEASPAELTARLRAARGGRFLVPGLPPIVALGEVIIHRADIAAAAGLPARPADDVTREVLEAELRLWFAFGVSPSMRKRRFVPTDADWAVGPANGPVVERAGEELLLVATGRIA